MQEAVVVHSAIPPEQKQSNAILSMVCVFSLAVGFYLLSFSGAPISDDEELFASAARNIAVTGKLSAEQLYGNPRIEGNYHGVEPAFPAVLSLWYRLFLNTNFGHLQSLYLLPVFFTGGSAALIVLIASQLNYSNSTGVVAGVLYALSTMAWPYAKTLFREPFIALLLLSSLAVFIHLTNGKRRLIPGMGLTGVLILILGLLTLTKITMVVAVFAFLFIPFLTHTNAGPNRRKAWIIALAGIVFLVLLFFYLTSFHAMDSSVFYRYTGTFLHDAIGRLTSISHSHLAEALLAPLFSPWKGLFFYSPVCLLGLISLVRYSRRMPGLFILPFSILIILLLNQALAYDGEWWTPTWGSRFLVPVIPLLIVASLPVIQELINLRKAGRVILGTLFVIGVIIQLPAVLFNSAEFSLNAYSDNSNIFPAAYIWNFTKTPIINQWQAIVSQQPDLLLWRAGYNHLVLALTVVFMIFVLIISAIFFLRRELTANLKGPKPLGLFFGSSLVGVLLTAIFVLQLGIFDPAYQTREFQPVCSFIHDNFRPGDILIIQPYPGPAWQYFTNTECGQKVWYSLPYDDPTIVGLGADRLANEWISQNPPFGSGIWLIEQFWQKPFFPEKGGITSGNYQLSNEKYFYTPVQIFAGYYTPVRK